MTRLALLLMLAAPLAAHDWSFEAVRASQTAYIAAHVADVASSRGLYERNAALRAPDGQIATGRALAVKMGSSIGIVVAQEYLIRRYPKKRWLRWVVVGGNAGGAAVLGWQAGKNWRLR